MYTITAKQLNTSFGSFVAYTAIVFAAVMAFNKKNKIQRKITLHEGSKAL